MSKTETKPEGWKKYYDRLSRDTKVHYLDEIENRVIASLCTIPWLQIPTGSLMVKQHNYRRHRILLEVVKSGGQMPRDMMRLIYRSMGYGDFNKIVDELMGWGILKNNSGTLVFVDLTKGGDSV